MDEPRLCTSCDAQLIGPFQPEIVLHQSIPVERADHEPLKVSARSWICSGCGLVHWYAEGIASLATGGSDDEALAPKPDASYQRRAQMLRMLRRVKRM